MSVTIAVGMADEAGSPVSNTGEDSFVLSTGQTVTLPLVTEATMLGAVFKTARARIQELLPDGLRPIGLTSHTAVITLLSVEYRYIGVDGIEPYNEFAILIPAVHGSARTLPFASLFNHATSGYMWYLPVTTESAKGLGVDIWGHPKVVADITHRDKESRRRTTVTVDGEHLLTFEVDRSPSISQQNSGYVYTVKEGTLLRGPNEVDGNIGMWPYSNQVSVTFGDHPRADSLQNLDLGDRAFARLSVEGTAIFHQGTPVKARGG
jgi:hypothetical protein